MGFHWTRCNPLGALVPGSIAIACLIISLNSSAILAAVTWAIFWGCIVLAAGMVLASIVLWALMRFLMPHTLRIQGDGWVTFRIVREEPHYDVGTNLRDMANDVIPGHSHVEVLQRSAYEWQDDRQLVIPRRRNKR